MHKGGQVSNCCGESGRGIVGAGSSAQMSSTRARDLTSVLLLRGKSGVKRKGGGVR